MTIDLSTRPDLLAVDASVGTLAEPPLAGAEPAPAPRGRRRWAGTAREVLRRPGLVLASLFSLAVLVSAVAPGLFTRYDPTATSPAEKLQAPGARHWFGTDTLGRDLYSRMLHGSGLTLEGTAIALGLALAAGLALGLIAGFVGGWVDAVLMRLVDVALAVPALLLALTIVTALGFGIVPMGVAVGVGIVPGFARTTRAEVLRVRTMPYVEAARTGGSGWLRVMVRHVLPNSWSPVLVLALLDIGTAIQVIAALSFLGFGAPPPQADWGALISDGRNYLVTSPWLCLLPGLFVAAAIFSVNHIARTVEGWRR
jgi:peptide/nickel transport system permease protein